MEALAVSTTVVALAEVGDKTQLLALVLAARFARPLPILAGILIATLANHALAGLLGLWITGLLGATALRWLLGLSFLAMGVWMLVADAPVDTPSRAAGLGVFGTTLVSFFLVEIGDKTQIATVALAARYQVLATVVAGTTLGMLAANAPAVLVGDRLGARLPIAWIHRAAAFVFVALGLLLFAQALGVA